MKLKRCTNGSIPGWQWGDTGSCYIGENARRLASSQAISSGEGKFSDMGQFDINRSVFMFDMFDQSSSEDMIKALLELDQKSPGEPINIFINSYGGEVLSLFAILDTIAGLNSQVNTICLGEADSCGAVLLSAGDFRYIGKNSRSMIHEVSAMSWGKINEMEEQIKLAKEVNDKLISHLSKNIGQDFTVLKDMMKNDVWLDSKGTKDLGIVDFVMEENLFDIFKNVFHNMKDMTMVYTNSVNGRSSDGVVTNLLYDVIKKGGVAKSASTTNNTKGVSKMDKEQMLVALKDQFQLDVQAVLSDVSSLKAEVESVKTENETLKLDNTKLNKELSDIQTAQRDKEFDEVLSSLIDSGKSTQVLNDTVYKVAFMAMGIEKAKEVAKTLPVIVKQHAVGSNADDNSTDDVEKDHALILAIQAADKCSYNDAARKFYIKRKGQE